MMAMLMLLFTSCGDQKLKVGVSEGNNPPYTYEDSSREQVGFEVDLVKEVAKRMGKTVEIESIEWSQRTKTVNKGDVDILIGALTTDSQKNEENLTKAYLTGEVVAVSIADEITSTEELAGKKVAVLQDSQAYYTLGLDKEFRDLIESWVAFTDSKGLFDSLDKKENDFILCDKEMVKYISKESDIDYKVSSIGYETSYVMQVSDKKILKQVQDILDKMASDNTGKELSEKWFGDNKYYR